MTQNIVFDFQKLKGKIVEVFGSQEKFAEEMGISNVSLSRKMNNKSRFSADNIILICELLDIPNKDISDYFYKQAE